MVLFLLQKRAKMRIVLIKSDAEYQPTPFVGKKVSVEPIGIEYIGGIVALKGHRVKIIQQESLSTENFLKKILDFDPDLVGFSVLAYNFNYSKKLAGEIKARTSRIVTVFGGDFPSALPEIVKDKTIDYVVMGEGEITFCELIETLESNGDISKIKGIAYYNGKVKVTQPRERIADLDNPPWPLRSSELLENCKSIAIAYPPPSQQKNMAFVTFSRGCPYSCTYCNTPQVWETETIWRKPYKVAEEIKCLQEEFDTNIIGFTDLTFNLNHQRVYEFCHELKQQKVEVSWLCGCRLENIDVELLKAMKEVGCTRINYGIESLNPATLGKIGRGKKIDFIKQNLELTHSQGFLIRGYLMIGYPWEDKDDIWATGHLIKDFAIDDLRITFFTPFPATPLYNEFKQKGLLLTENFDEYTTDQPVIRVPGLSPEDLLEIRKKIFQEFYHYKEYEQRVKEKIMKYPYLKQSYDEFFELLYSKRVL
jgi:anaerobic magnesium-protoporphyrin IX monomethyl ester cyclase